MDEHVIPECFVDTNLVETLVPPTSRYNHQHGCGAVTTLMKGKLADQFALAVIDRDKHQVDYLSEFTLLTYRGSLLLHKHKTRNHYIIQIFPAMERLIIINAANCGISLQQYDLPADIERLKKESKTRTSKNDTRFKNLFRALVNNGAEDLIRLRDWIIYLKVPSI